MFNIRLELLQLSLLLTDGPCQDRADYAKNCIQFKWACKDTRYPWFKEQCEKTCKVC